MSRLRVMTAAEQVAAHLRADLRRGAWGGRMAGGARLAVELGVGRDTVEAALRQLEADGSLVPQGAGRRRSIAIPEVADPVRPLRVTILLSEPADRQLSYVVDLQHSLVNAGHHARVSQKCLRELGMNALRVQRLVEQKPSDAWIVASGSREVLEWFATGPWPAFALFGRRRGLPLAGTGPDKPPAMAAATRRLIELGHRRIVLLNRAERRLPVPGATEQAFLATLKAHGITPSRYHLPDWEESIEGFHARLTELFRVTPPTALIISEAQFWVAALQFCAGRGLHVPADVSLVCTDGSSDFAWCLPPVSHIRWDTGPVLRRIIRWVTHVSRGVRDVRQTLTKAEFVEGGTIAPVAGSATPRSWRGSAGSPASVTPPATEAG